MSNKNKTTEYYAKVADYYDQEAATFEAHYLNNKILQRLRNEFRTVTERYDFETALEIGCGPGMDLEYFAKKYPNRLLRGIDVSKRMVMLTNQRLGLLDADVKACVATPERLQKCFPGQTFDLIYCYFGALNTVADLSQTAAILKQIIADKGTLVLTFVNQWFLFDIIWNLLRFRFRRAFSRLLPVWPGYSPDRPLQSVCRSSREIQKLFSPCFHLAWRNGYSILYPAWYRHRFLAGSGRLGELLWQMDRFLNKTPFWNLGEYSLYVFKPKP